MSSNLSASDLPADKLSSAATNKENLQSDSHQQFLEQYIYNKSNSSALTSPMNYQESFGPAQQPQLAQTSISRVKLAPLRELQIDSPNSESKDQVKTLTAKEEQMLAKTPHTQSAMNNHYIVSQSARSARVTPKG